jgi:hypothetical protein
MNLFKRKQLPPPSYRPPLEAAEIIQLFTQLTLHQQAALMRLMSRNLVLTVDGEQIMGYEFDYNVDGAMIVATPETEED